MLAHDAHAYPAFATARRAFLLAAIEREGTVDIPTCEYMLMRVREYEDGRGARVPDERAVTTVRYFINTHFRKVDARDLLDVYERNRARP